MRDGLGREKFWYKSGVFYEVHVRAFYDADGDGTGDFRGLTEKLDYIKDLGVTAIWLLPFYPSPLKDDGYDIADYCDVHPMYGTLGDFKKFLAEAHRHGLRVITELVLNHTSDQHPWFQRARRAVSRPARLGQNAFRRFYRPGREGCLPAGRRYRCDRFHRFSGHASEKNGLPCSSFLRGAASDEPTTPSAGESRHPAFSRAAGVLFCRTGF